MHNKYINNTYDKLLDSIMVDTYISLYRKDIENISYGYLYKERLPSNIKSKIIDLLQNYIESSSPNFNNIFVFALFISLNEKKLKKKIIIEVENIIKSLITSETYPIGQKSHLSFLLKRTNLFNNVKQQLSEYLTIKAVVFFESGKEEAGILASYSLIDNQFIQHHITFCENFLKRNIEHDELSRLSTFLKSIIYISINSEDEVQFASKTELIIAQTINNSNSPDLWFVLSKSEKIIHSNLDLEVMNKILNVLKDNNNKWSKLIQNVQSSSITVNARNFIQFSSSSAIDTYYGLQTLELLNRNYVFSIPLNKAEEFERFISKSELSTNFKSIYILSGFIAIALSIIVVIIFQYNDIGAVKSFYESKVNPKSIKDILIFLKNPIALIGIIIWWIYIVFSRITTVYNVSIIDILMCNPIYLYLNKFFNHIKPNK